MVPCGSNLTFVDPGNTQGYVATYHYSRAQGQQNLAAMSRNGQTLARIFMPVQAAEEQSLQPGFVVPVDINSKIDTQSQTNLLNLISDLTAHGFTRVDLIVAPFGNTLGPFTWTGELGMRYKRGSDLYWHMHELMRPLNISYGIQAGGDDYFTNSFPTAMMYAQAVWTEYTARLTWVENQTGVPQPKDFCFSIPWTPASIQNLPIVLRGLNQDGPINWLPQFPLAAYGDGPGRSVYGDLMGVLVLLDALGAPPEIPWLASEGYVFDDLTSSVQLARAVQDAQRPCLGVYQWGVARDLADHRGYRDINPTLAGWPAASLSAMSIRRSNGYQIRLDS